MREQAPGLGRAPGPAHGADRTPWVGRLARPPPLCETLRAALRLVSHCKQRRPHLRCSVAVGSHHKRREVSRRNKKCSHTYTHKAVGLHWGHTVPIQAPSPQVEGEPSTLNAETPQGLTHPGHEEGAVTGGPQSSRPSKTHRSPEFRLYHPDAEDKTQNREWGLLRKRQLPAI